MSGQSVQAGQCRAHKDAWQDVCVEVQSKTQPLSKTGRHASGRARSTFGPSLLSAPASSPSIDADGARKVRLQTELLTRLQKSREGEGGLGERETKGGLGERETRETEGGLGERENKKRSTGPSRVVPHRSTTPARTCLTSLFGWEAVSQADVAALSVIEEKHPIKGPPILWPSHSFGGPNLIGCCWFI